MTDTATQAPADLRARIVTALTTTPASHVAGRDRPLDHHGEHQYAGDCALCRGEAEVLADAVVAAIGEEGMRQVADEMWRAIRVRSLEMRGGALNLSLDAAEHVAAGFVGTARTLLEGTENYTEMTFEAKVAEEPVAYVFTVRRRDRKTPHELRAQAEAERDRLRAELAAWHDRESAEAAAGSYAGRAEQAEGERDAALARIDALREVPGRLRQLANTPDYIDATRSRALREAADLVDKALIDTAPNALAEDDEEE